MKIASVKELKDELQYSSQEDLINLCLHLAKFKKENKELLSYLLFYGSNEEEFIIEIKAEIDEAFETINTNSYYFIKKSVRKILRFIKKYIRYSKNKETEIELLLYFCKKLKSFKPSIQNNQTLYNIYLREKSSIIKKLAALHEDLQYDYKQQLSNL